MSDRAFLVLFALCCIVGALSGSALAFAMFPTRSPAPIEQSCAIPELSDTWM